MFTYLKADRTAGYSGFVLYVFPTSTNASDRCVWMVPGTFFDDWDNQFKNRYDPTEAKYIEYN